MTTRYYTRNVKAEWGIYCNQSADGRLWVGKGYRRSLAGQLGEAVAAAVRDALEDGRGDRCGHFWLDLETRTLTMMVGVSYENEVEQVTF